MKGYNRGMKHSSIELTNQLLNKISKIKLNDAATILGGSSEGAILNDLRSGAVELQGSLNGDSSYDEIMKSYEALAGAVDTAGVTGLISEAEMADYYTLVDNIWTAIEREKPNK